MGTQTAIFMVPGCAANQMSEDAGCLALASSYVDLTNSLERHTAVTRDCSESVAGWATVTKSIVCGSELPSGLTASLDVL